MLILGAGGFATELLQNFSSEEKQNLVFYDDVNLNSPNLVYQRFPILRNLEAAKDYLESSDHRFFLGLGIPNLRLKLQEKFSKIGGQLMSSISNKAIIGNYNVSIGDGCTVLANAVISNSVKLGKGCLVYYNVNITHDCIIEDFVELSPGVILLGNVKVGAFTSIGANATVLPGIKIGKNVTVGAGTVVTKSLPDNCVAVGVPAKIIKIRNGS
ncbi:sugar O-acyltransferase (sialic acid O-acetyltransferase NeuD family) [Salegentibacter sp. 24]|uniref:NeuD/PglB/VioB family sugar acetyltransferase n=1 Tax=Salegentibacter sp. 24 TaxID=2183986 RepID=UPI00105B4D9B|nr:NeuD/PglB/VioB family sugar acetyltransferase [Salegentibacter sp. 24]TDN82188.1 sugar O-acyltransferase (sialic acid O-acetyltransferase NeuD family) [Salegentibacter sp. 24]